MAAHKIINLALQGGGSHGAFTWGVCDRLLEDERLEIEGIVGTSAGAMNATVLADGFAEDGRDGARRALRRFWTKVGESGRYSPLQRSPWRAMQNSWRVDDSLGFFWFDLMTRLFSPYQWNPLNKNPLEDLIKATVDFDRLRTVGGIKLYICATNVRSGKVRVFEKHELTADVLMASACLPFMFQAVQVQGEAYWDGGYMGNPAIFPLIYNCDSSDVLLVQINPMYREEVPTTGRDILDRVGEISFNSSLMREMRAIHFVSRLIDGGHLSPEQYKQLNMHMIEAEQELAALGASSKLSSEPAFLEHLFEIGRKSADAWLSVHFDDINHRSTLDLAKTFF
ncbi:MAG: patatin-like phospholipase family protein [Elstera sp.]|jgi:NTE family protein